jgi:hypothetical protein
MALAVECFGKAQPQRMDLVRSEFQRSPKEISREDFCEQMRRILAQQFPDETVHFFSETDSPRGNRGLLANRLAALNPQLALQVYELNPFDEQIERVDPCANGNVNTWLVPRRGSELLKCRAAGTLAPIVALRPDAISVHAVPQEQEVVLRFRGFTFARWKDGQVYFAIVELKATENPDLPCKLPTTGRVSAAIKRRAI